MNFNKKIVFILIASIIVLMYILRMQVRLMSDMEDELNEKSNELIELRSRWEEIGEKLTEREKRIKELGEESRKLRVELRKRYEVDREVKEWGKVNLPAGIIDMFELRREE